MTVTDTRWLPDLGAVLGGVLARVAREQQPLLVAIALRIAARRYRGWAPGSREPAHRAQLLACAAREEEIAGLEEQSAEVLEAILASSDH